MFDHLKGLCPDFASCKYRGFLSRFKERAIHALDSSTIQLTLNCFDWARHRRQKAAAKLHMNLDLGNRLPSFAIVEEASRHDSVRAEVEYDGNMLEMSFLTNNMEWSARTIAELYRARWGIETFFKELKQTCQIRDFIGYSEMESAWCRSPDPCIRRLSCRSTPGQWDSTGRKARVFGAFRHRDEKRGCVQVVGIFKNTGCNTNFRTL